MRIRDLKLPAWMDESIKRMDTMRAVERALRKYGPHHVATFAAIGRAHRIWQGIIRPPAIEGRPDAEALAHAYTTSQLRALGAAGWANRRYRRHIEDRMRALLDRLRDSRPDLVVPINLEKLAAEVEVPRPAPYVFTPPSVMSIKGV